MTRALRLLFALALLCAMPMLAEAGTIHVPAEYSTIEVGLNHATTGDTVLVAQGTYYETFIHWPSVSGIVLHGSGDSSGVIVDGEWDGRIFNMSNSPDTFSVVSNMTIRKASSGMAEGGCFFSDGGSFKVSSVHMDSSITGWGGAIGTYYTTVVIENCTMTTNYAYTSGGAVSFGNNCIVIIRGSTFEANGFGRTTYGGALNSYRNTSLEITNCIFDGNTAQNYGGAIYIMYSPTVLKSVTIKNNSSGGRTGGGVGCENANVTLVDVIADSNKSGTHGGGFFFTGSTVTISSLSATGNQSLGKGGALYLESSLTTGTTLTLTGNSSGDYAGAGLYASGGGISLSDVTITGHEGPSTITLEDGECQFSNSTFSGNDGCVISADSSTLVLRNVDILKNTSSLTSIGTVINTSGGLLGLENVNISDNHSTSTSGGINLNGTDLLMDVVEFSNNSSRNHYGAGYIYGGTIALEDLKVYANTSYGQVAGFGFESCDSIACSNSTFIENSGSGAGAVGLTDCDNVTFENVSFYRNESAFSGNAVSIETGTDATFTNCTFSGPLTYGYSPLETAGVYVGENGNGSFYKCNFSIQDGYALRSVSSSVTVVADSCWWEDANGPFISGVNESTEGNPVSQYVSVSPWLTTPDVDAPLKIPTGLAVLDSMNGEISVAWDSCLVKDYAGYKIYLDYDSTTATFADTTSYSSASNHAHISVTMDAKSSFSLSFYDTDGNESWITKPRHVYSPAPSAPGAFSLLSPGDGTLIGNDDLFPMDFSWEMAVDTDPQDTVTYTLQLSTDAEFTSPIEFEADTNKTYSVTRLEIDSYYWRVVAKDKYGEETNSTDTWTLDVTLSVADEASLPTEYSISRLYPNPFNPTLTVVVALPEAAHLNVAVYNVVGRKVAELVNGRVEQGYRNFTFNASEMASGVYFVNAVIPGKMNQMSKAVLMK